MRWRTVHPEVGYKVRLTYESDVVCQIEKILADLQRDRNLLDRLRQQGMRYAREMLNLGAEGVAHDPDPDLGREARSETRSTGSKNAALGACVLILRTAAQHLRQRLVNAPQK
jgi:hypothetical protein